MRVSGNSFRWAVVALATGAWLAAWLLVRVRYVQAEHLVDHCAGQPQALVCGFRDLVGKAMHFNVFGYASLGLAGVALLLPRSAGEWLAAGTLAAAVVALVLYNAGLGAPAAVLALLRIARRTR
jgi:hypothetical protein